MLFITSFAYVQLPTANSFAKIEKKNALTSLGRFDSKFDERIFQSGILLGSQAVNFPKIKNGAGNLYG